jgi:hypothetical protein
MATPWPNDPRIDRSLDVPLIAGIFARYGRVTIPSFLDAGTAKALQGVAAELALEAAQSSAAPRKVFGGGREARALEAVVRETVGKIANIARPKALQLEFIAVPLGTFRPLHGASPGGHEIDGTLFFLSLNPRWRPEWGGLIEFYDERLNIIEAYTPYFNQMSLIRMPQTCAICEVAAFAGAPSVLLSGVINAK